MNNFGQRLKEERERLGKTQADFAKAGGVGRTAQFNYEREERRPSSSYLSGIEALGADSLYIMTGNRQGKDGAWGRVYGRMLYTIEMLLGLEEGRLEKIAVMVKQVDEVLDDATKNRGLVSYEDFFVAMADWLKTSTKISDFTDLHLFAEIVGEVDKEIIRRGITVSPEKKAHVLVMLYRTFKPTGKVDMSVLVQTLKLAVPEEFEFYRSPH
ncbi:MAG: helix-turn-helix transcriptional regulator [Burkholderiaceae bacterium]|nr:helix-turn-helix transcriptional regulator [Burkholderiaceae bacterium]